MSAVTSNSLKDSNYSPPQIKSKQVISPLKKQVERQNSQAGSAVNKKNSNGNINVNNSAHINNSSKTIKNTLINSVNFLKNTDGTSGLPVILLTPTGSRRGSKMASSTNTTNIASSHNANTINTSSIGGNSGSDKKERNSDKYIDQLLKKFNYKHR